MFVRDSSSDLDPDFMGFSYLDMNSSARIRKDQKMAPRKTEIKKMYLKKQSFGSGSVS
jgi:hypothetical protein